MIRKLIYFIGSIVILIFMVKILVLLLAIALGLPGFNKATIDNCIPGTQKCDGTIRLICNNKKNWEADFCWDDKNKTCCEKDGFAYCSWECQ